MRKGRVKPKSICRRPLRRAERAEERFQPAVKSALAAWCWEAGKWLSMKTL